MSKPLRVLHFSDIHIDSKIRHMRPKDWLSKRAIGAINLLRGRSKYFDNAKLKLEALARFKEENGVDIIINCGDYTALGLEQELKIAKDLVAPMMYPPQNYITVPGNHDIYVDKNRSHDSFLEQFGSVLKSDLPEYTQKDGWPLVRLVDGHTAIIALNSARPNLPWRSNGHIPTKDLKAFDGILKDERVKGRFIFVVTHYAPKLANGENDKRLHGLSNVEEFLDSCRAIDFGAILCGHIHRRYRVDIKDLKSEIFCSGSVTMRGREGGWLYELDGDSLSAFELKWSGREFYLDR